MIKNKVSFERQLDDRLYQFMVPGGAPSDECLAFLEDIKKHILNLIEESKNQSKVTEENSEQEVK